MKKLFLTIIAASMLVFGAESGNDLFQKALVMERTEGNVAGAVKLYQRIVDEFASDRKLTAKTLLQMGLCYEKLGKDEAQKAYQQIIGKYADQAEVATQARERLAVLAKSGNGERR